MVYSNPQKVLTKLPAGCSVNIQDYKSTHIVNLRLTCSKKHVSKYDESWNAIKKRIVKDPNKICFECQNKKPLRPNEVIYNECITKCLLMGLVVDTQLKDFGGRKSKVDVRCFKHEHVQKNVLVESINFRSKGCSECQYGKIKDGTVYKIKSQKCKCKMQCLKCKIYDGLIYMKHTVSQYKPIDYKWIVKQYLKQNGQCHYSGLELDTTGKSKMKKLSIDRLNNTMGHTPHNCVLTTQGINVCKGQMNDIEFLAWLDQIANHISTDRQTLSNLEKSFIKSKLSSGMKNNSNISRAIRIKCLVTFEDLLDLCMKSKNKCAISNVNIVWLPNRWNTGSFDRIDSNLHYSKDNIQIVTVGINLLKLCMTTDECKQTLTALLYE